LSDDDQNRANAERRGDSPGSYAECAYVHDLAAGYALNALDPDDQQHVDDHVAACKACDLVIAQAMQTVAMLPFTAKLVSPPLDAKAQLFSRIAHSSRPQTGTLPSRTPTIPASSAEQTTQPQPSRRWQLPTFGRRERGRINLPLLAVPLATVPLVVALALLGTFAMSSQSKVGDLRAELLSARSDLNDAHETLDTVEGFTASEDAKVYEIPADGAKNNGGAHGKVIANPGTNEAMLMIWRLDNKPKGCTYQVVLESKDGQMQTAAEFGVDNEGHGAAKLSLDEPFDNYAILHIKRKYTDDELVSTVTPISDSLVATIGPSDNPFYDRIASSTP
jgi:hypothetical protein